MQEPLVFPDAVLSLVDVWSDRAGARSAFAELGVDVDKLAPAYPVPVFRKLLERTAVARFPNVEFESALFQVGAASVEPYTRTALGKALATMLRLIGPARALRRIARSLRSTNNYSNAQVSQLTATEFEVAFDLVVVAPYEQGVITAGLTLAGAKDVSVGIVRRTPVAAGESAVYHARWK